ncbi:MAG TPA: ACP S-malonyltransferase [Thermodesulfobacteriota bacterium]|nr:ACP S-malonyltransferase [Thermodesulfobacteriota bacterium]
MIAFVFPGQGSQYVGMCKELYDGFSAAREAFDEAGEALGIDMAKLCFESPQEELSLTANAQPAILTASVACLRVLGQETGLEPDFVAGHSLGEYSALVANGGMDFADAVRVVRKRGEYMQEAVPVGVGAMSAVLGLDIEDVEDICRQASGDRFIVSPANMNAPGQTVISGNREAVAAASEAARAKGARRVVPLDVSAPFHCALMKPAAERLAETLSEINFSPMSAPIVINCDAAVNNDPGKTMDILVRQVTSPVRWYESVETLGREGATRFIEIGPGNVLSGLIRRTLSNMEISNIENTAQLESLKNGRK